MSLAPLVRESLKMMIYFRGIEEKDGGRRRRLVKRRNMPMVITSFCVFECKYGFYGYYAYIMSEAEVIRTLYLIMPAPFRLRYIINSKVPMTKDGSPLFYLIAQEAMVHVIHTMVCGCTELHCVWQGHSWITSCNQFKV